MSQERKDVALNRCADLDTDGARCGDVEGHDGKHSWHVSVETLWSALDRLLARLEAARDVKLSERMGFDCYVSWEMYDEAAEQGALLGVKLTAAEERNAKLRAAMERIVSLRTHFGSYATHEPTVADARAIARLALDESALTPDDRKEETT